MPLLSEIQFGSYLVYSPHGKEEISKKSKNLCHSVKQDGNLSLGNPSKFSRTIPFLVQRLKASLSSSPLAGLFDGETVLVPAPRSSPLKAGSLSPTNVICQFMLKEGLGIDVQPLLERTIVVPKAAFAKAEERPTCLTHYGSLAVRKQLGTPKAILLVDDVVTAGRMLLSSVSKLKDAYPDARIGAFALIRTMSGIEIKSIADPCLGKIILRGDRETTYRAP